MTTNYSHNLKDFYITVYILFSIISYNSFISL